MAAKDIVKHRMKKGQTLNPNGRPRKSLGFVNEELKKEGFERVSNAQVLEAYEICINLTEEKIKAIVTNAEYPMFLRIVGKQMLSAKGVDMIEKILDRAFGKAVQKQETELNVNGFVDFLKNSSLDKGTDTQKV